MVKAYIIEDGQKPTKEQLDEVREAAKREIQFDEDARSYPRLCIKYSDVPPRSAAEEGRTLNGLKAQ